MLLTLSHRCAFYPSYACISLPQMCCTESGASDVTCGWLYCSLHHLWIHIHPLKKMKPNSINNSERETSARFTTTTILWLNVALKMIYCTVLSTLSQYNKSVFTGQQLASKWLFIVYSLETFQLTVVTLKCLYATLLLIGPYDPTWSHI